MSRYAGNNDRCPGCGMRYGDLRTGLTYHDVYTMLWVHSPDHRDWKQKSRGVVLGLWHRIKRDLWERHTESECTELVPF